MSKQFTFVALICGIVGTGCSTIPQESFDKATVPEVKSTLPNGSEGDTVLGQLINCDGTINYRPIPTFAASDYTEVLLGNDGKVTFRKQVFPSNAVGVNALLPNISTEVAIEDLGISATAPFGSSDTKHRKVTIDFMKYRTEPISGESGAFFGYGRVGAGMRLTIDVFTTENSISGSLVALAASAKANKTSGTISADTIGINHGDVTLSMPFTTDLSEASIQRVIEALAVIKSKLHDPTANLSPQFLARVQCKKLPVTK